MELKLWCRLWTFVVLCVSSSLLQLEGEFDWDDQSNQEWVDPTDMLNYDIGSQSMKKPAVVQQGMKKTAHPAHQGGVDKDNPAFNVKPPIKPKEENTFVNEPNQASKPDVQARDDVTQHRDSGSQQQTGKQEATNKKKSDVHTMDSPGKTAHVIDGCSDLSSSIAALRKEKSALQNELKECQAADTRPPSEKPYFKQYINVLLKQFKKQGLPDFHAVSYSINVELSSDEIKILQRYADGKQAGVQDAHSVLVHMIKGTHIVYSNEASFELSENAKMRLSLVAQICCVVATAFVGLFVYVKLRLAWTQLFFKVLVLMFFISIPWNWWHLYKVEIASRQAAAMQDAPAECRPDKLGYWQSFSALFSIESNKCAKYYEKLLVDPMWEVPPTKAVAVTLAKFFLEPLRHIGEHLGLFIKASLHDLPVQLWPFVFAFTIFMLSVVVIMSFGYKIRLFHLFGLEPGRRVGEQGAGMVQQSIQDLRGEIQKLADTPANPPPASQLFRPALEERIEDIVYQAVQSSLPPALCHAKEIAKNIPAQPISVQSQEKFHQIEYSTSPVQVETVDTQTESCQSEGVQSVEDVTPAKKVEVVDVQTQSTPKPKKKLSTTNVTLYSFPGTVVEALDENKMEKTVTRHSSVVMRDNWSQTWITSGENGKFSDLDEKTFCDVHASWKPYQQAYFPEYYQDEDYQSNMDSGSDAYLGAYSTESVIAARPESRNSTWERSEEKSSASFVPSMKNNPPGSTYPGVDTIDIVSCGNIPISQNPTALKRPAPGPVETMLPGEGL